jgi:hypothetical protein
MTKIWMRILQEIGKMVTPGRLELPAYGLGNRRSILLSYGVMAELLPYLPRHFHSFVPSAIKSPHPGTGTRPVPARSLLRKGL